MRRVLSPIPIAVILAGAALVGLLAYGLSANEPDRGIEHAIAITLLVLEIDCRRARATIWPAGSETSGPPISPPWSASWSSASSG